MGQNLQIDPPRLAGGFCRLRNVDVYGLAAGGRVARAPLGPTKQGRAKPRVQRRRPSLGGVSQSVKLHLHATSRTCTALCC
eukprot:10578306-Alexandrium_andersonii.AAC.1